MKNLLATVAKVACGLILLSVLSGNSICRAERSEVAAQEEFREELNCLYKEMKDSWSLKDYSKALAVAKKIVRKNEKRYGDHNPNLIVPLIDLGNLYCLSGKTGKAEKEMKRALEISEKAFEWDHPNMLNALRGLSGVYSVNRKYTAAQPLLLRVLAIERKNFSEDSPEVKETKGLLGRVFAMQGKLSEAEVIVGRKAFKRLMAEAKPAAVQVNSKTKGEISREIWFIVGAIFLLLVITGAAMSKALRLEVIFFNDVLDVLLSIAPLIILLVLLLIGAIKQNNEYLSIARHIVFPFCICYSVAYNMLMPWVLNRKLVSSGVLMLVCIGLSRLIVANFLPVGALILYFVFQTSRGKDDDAVYEMRKAMMQLQLMLFLGALAGLIRYLTNGDAVRAVTGKRNNHRVNVDDRDDEVKSGSRFQYEKCKPLNPYDVLGVSPNDSKDAVVHAYRNLAVKYHPDKVASLGEELRALANKKMKEINWAYSAILKGNGKYSYS